MTESVKDYGGGVEMAVVCSDLSLLENINALLGDRGVIGIRGEDGIVHYIIDGRQNRGRASAAVTALVSGKAKGDVDEEFFDMCIKSVFKEFGLEIISEEFVHKHSDTEPCGINMLRGDPLFYQRKQPVMVL